ncbi:MAG: alpha-L-rhamnosidase N-terminal domain-containing protein, partial [Limisphaerales bacterium]
MDITRPRLSWVLSSDERGQKQTTYQILVASSAEGLGRDEGDLWNSGKIPSDDTAQVIYRGKPLTSRLRAWWKVRVWDKTGVASAWSSPAQWEMGLLNRNDWDAEWVSDPAAMLNQTSRGPLNGYHSEFAGQSDSVKWVAVDLSEIKMFDSVRLFPARPYDWQPDTPGFLFPLRFKLETGQKADFSDARVLVDRSTVDEPNPGTNAPIYTFAPTSTRFVRLLVTALPRRDGTNFAFALAEMQVLHEGKNLAEHAGVVASDSIETGSWSKSNLTDGVETTVPAGGGLGSLPVTMVRREFRLSQPVRSARAYTSALGLYELRINGQRVGKQLLAPEWTSYRKRVQYQTYDVTPLLHKGANAVGALVGEGWYTGRLMAVGRFAYGTFPRFLLQLEIELADGSKQLIVTDGSWRSTAEGPIRAAGIYDGEIYDAR